MRFLVLIFTVLMMACNSTGKSDVLHKELKQLSWLIGEWQIVKDSTIIKETWVLRNDSMMQGLNTYVKNQELKSTETIEITYKQSTLYYIPTVSNQNDGQAVYFKLIDINDTMVVFENQQHDFPTRIVYKKLSDSTCLAKISGMIKSEERIVEFDFKRVK